MPLSKILPFMLLMCLLVTGAAHAQKETGLTEESIRSLYAEVETLHKKPFAEYLAVTKKTTHENYQAQMLIRISNGKDAPAEVSFLIDKKMILDQAKDGYEGLAQATVTETIESIAISPDKKSATIKLKIIILNQKIPMGEDPMQTTLADSEATGTDEVVYTPHAGIQFIKSDYTTNTTIKQEQEL